MKHKLICLDMDGVIFKNNNFWLILHKELNTLEQGMALTEQYLRTDYSKLVEEVVGKLWKNKPAEPYLRLIERAEYNPNVKESISKLKKKGYKFCIISSGPEDLVKRAMTELGIKVGYGNKLVIKDGVITGEFRWLSAYNNKLHLLKSVCNDLGLKLSEVIAVGDDENDLELFKNVGIGIAFNTTSFELRAVADYVVESNDFYEVYKIIESL